MKKAFFVLLLASLVCSTAFAQESNQTQSSTNTEFNYSHAARPAFNEISLTYGIPTFTDIGFTIGFGIGSVIIIPVGGKLDGTEATGAFALDYMRYVKSGRFAFGAVVSFEHMTIHFATSEGKRLSDDHADFLTVMPEFKTVWINKKHVSAYSRVAAGLLLETTDGNPGFAFQVDPFCCDFGGEHFRGFVQLGFGNLGIIQAGIRTCF